MSGIKPSQAGTLESNDIMITVAPGSPGSGMAIELESIVFAQYGEAIRRVIVETLATNKVTDIYVKAVDRGALDCTIKARVTTALVRSGAVAKGAAG